MNILHLPTKFDQFIKRATNVIILIVAVLVMAMAIKLAWQILSTDIATTTKIIGVLST